MPNFYGEWLNAWNESEAERQRARLSIDEEDYEWIETPQDHRAALLIARANGFQTWGGVTMIAEIPPGHQTGQHKHGEECIYIVAGAGFSIVDGVRYDWKEGSMILVPFAAEHQHYNTGHVPARYVSALLVDLERYVGLHRTVQLDIKGRTTTIPDVPISVDGLRPDGKRCVLHREHATPMVGEGGRAEAERWLAEGHLDPDHPIVVHDVSGFFSLPMALHKEQIWSYMSISAPEHEFEPTSCEMKGILVDRPHEYGGKHAHMEAHLFTLAGEGYSEVGDHKVPWKKGTAFHVQGPQTPHRHFNTSDEPMQQLRICFGVRYFFEKVAGRAYPYLFIEPAQSLINAELEMHEHHV